MKLLIDIGNSRMKWCVEQQGKLTKARAIDYKCLDFTKQIRADWLLLDIPVYLAISSVGDKKNTKEIIDVATKIWPTVNIFRAKSSASDCSVINAYQQPETLGVDRWLGLIALHHYYPGNACIVDCGTAITIDFLDKQGQHLGGVISPGLQLMKRSLFNETEDLELVSEVASPGLANNTAAAISSGAHFASIGLIEKVIGNYNVDGTILLTGGDAQILSECLNFEMIVDPDFILKGLSLLCDKEVS